MIELCRVRNIAVAGAVVGLFMAGALDARIVAAQTYDWCYNECDSEQECEQECENDGGGTITCGEYYDGPADGWCDGNTCDNECSTWSHPGQSCWWENEHVDCGEYGLHAVCGDDTCQNTAGETCSNCSDDCDPCPDIVCGNSVCEEGETYRTCPADCEDTDGTGSCGDGICSDDDGETSSNCEQDCVMPNERCEDDYDCPAGYSCASGGELMGGQCVLYSSIIAYGTCTSDAECIQQKGTGYVCRAILLIPGPGSERRCIFWYDLE